MEDLGPTDLKSILHSKRANIYYLQHCRVLVNGRKFATVEVPRSDLGWLWHPRLGFIKNR